MTLHWNIRRRSPRQACRRLSPRQGRRKSSICWLVSPVLCATLACLYGGTQWWMASRATSIDEGTEATSLPPQLDLKLSQLPRHQVLMLYTKEQRRRFHTYDFAHHPVVPESVFVPHSDRPLPLFFLAGTDDYENNELLDGLQRSRYVDVMPLETHKPKRRNETAPPVIHLVDWALWQYDCHLLESMYKKLSAPETQQNSILVYWDTSPSSSDHGTCSNLNRHFACVRQVSRGIVVDRYWNPNRNWIEPGHVVDQKQQESPILYAPRTLPESFVSLELVQEERPKDQQDWVKKLVHQNRPIDVLVPGKVGDYSYYSFFRRLIVNDLAQLGNETSSLRIEIVSNFTAAKATRSKFVVLTTHDEWEDPEFLMPAMASGALVLMPVLWTPPRGVQNGTNVITYHSLSTLKTMAAHYLADTSARRRMALAGANLVLGKHRSWHRVEQILFGAARSHVGKPTLFPPPRRDSE